MVESSLSANKISIWLAQPEFLTNQAITGNVCVNGKMRASELRLSFFGYDNLTEWQRHQNGNHRYLRRSFRENRFVEATMQIAKFASSSTEGGKCAYPFQINIPENLPQTVHFNSTKVQGLLGNLCYFLVAELYDGEEVVEAFDTEVMINRPEIEAGPVDYEDTRMVGGYFGYRQTSSTNKFQISTAYVRPGDTIRVTLDSNNEKCQHKIQEFKYKLFRRVYYESCTSATKSMCEYLTYTKLDGCKRGDAVSKDAAVEIPNFEADASEQLCPSVDTKLFKVQYSLRCFVKWAAIFEPGPGQAIDFPIIVLNKRQAEAREFDTSYKVNARVTSCDLATEGNVNLYNPDQWTELKKPWPLNMWENKVDDEGHRFGCDKLSAVIKDPVSMPLPEPNAQFIFPLLDDNQTAYKDIWKVNDPEWREKHTTAQFVGAPRTVQINSVPKIEQEESSSATILPDTSSLGKTNTRLLGNQVAASADTDKEDQILEL